MLTKRAAAKAGSLSRKIVAADSISSALNGFNGCVDTRSLVEIVPISYCPVLESDYVQLVRSW